MKTMAGRAWILPLLVAVLLTACQGQDRESAAIRKRVSDYVEAFNQQDSQALASQWTQDAHYINSFTGNIAEGREAIEGHFQKLFEEIGSNAKYSLHADFITFPDPRTAVEQGVAELSIPGKGLVKTLYKATYVKQEDRWLISKIGEAELFEAPSNYEQLKELEWLVGDWVDDGEEVKVFSNCSWDKCKNFLTQIFTIKVHGRNAIDGKQIIAWDPSEKIIRSWVFDSDGGFGEGTWIKKAGHWDVEIAFTLPDGSKAWTIQHYKKINDDSYAFASTDRQVEGEIFPDIAPVTITRIRG